jgi:hypothetical protein
VYENISKMVVKIISADNQAIEIGKDEVPRIPYLTDIIDNVDDNIDVPIIGIDAKALKIIKELLELQTIHGLPFKSEPVEIQKYGVMIKHIPIQNFNLWEGKTSYYEYLNALSTEECIMAFQAADYLKCYDVRSGIAYIISQRQLDFDPDIIRLMKIHFSDYLIRAYLSIVV